MTRFENEANGLLITLDMLSCDAIVDSNNSPLSPPPPHHHSPPRKRVPFQLFRVNTFLWEGMGISESTKVLEKVELKKTKVTITPGT